MTNTIIEKPNFKGNSRKYTHKGETSATKGKAKSGIITNQNLKGEAFPIRGGRPTIWFKTPQRRGFLHKGETQIRDLRM
jgi:hypothetical protein